MEFHSISRTRRRRAAVFGGIVLSATLVAGCASTPAQPDGEGGGDNLDDLETVTLTYADYAQEASGGAIKAFAAEVAEKSGGKITIEPYFGGSLLGVADMLSGVSSGVADMGNVPATFVAQEMPISDWMTGLTTGSSESFPLQSLETATATIETVLSSPDLLAEAESNGIKVLYATANDPRYDMICNNEYTTLDSLKGAITSANGQIWVGEAEAIGMTTTSLPPGEQYEGLERGVIDCSIVSPISPMDFGLWEVARYYHKMQFAGFNAGRTIISSSSWDGLSDQAKQIIWDALPVLAIEKTKHNIAQYARLATEGPAEHDLEFVVPDDDVLDALRDFQATQLDTLAERAPASLSDPEGFIDAYLASLDEYGSQFIESMGLDPEPSSDPVAAYVDAADVDLAPYEEAIRKIYADNAGK